MKPTSPSKALLLGLPLLFLATSPRALAVIHAEIGDAGELTSTAQSTPAGSLTTITGRLESGNGNDRDMFAINIDDPFTFSAITTLGGDPMLTLFDAAGIGILMDDDNGSGLQAQLLAGNPALTALTPGLYYLAISDYPDKALSAGGEIFSSFNQGLPTGPGGASPITGWSGGSPGTYDYSITLRGASGAESSTSSVPDGGSTLACLGFALAGLGGVRRYLRNR